MRLTQYAIDESEKYQYWRVGATRWVALYFAITQAIR
jgi:hypothetical protein